MVGGGGGGGTHLHLKTQTQSCLQSHHQHRLTKMTRRKRGNEAADKVRTERGVWCDERTAWEGVGGGILRVTRTEGWGGAGQRGTFQSPLTVMGRSLTRGGGRIHLDLSQVLWEWTEDDSDVLHT
uniref:Uncharacterized protein n=1 Tax=Knipowitschia caucasica TaxID=637954 RepID=A0AAV2MAN4_KNICA